MAAQVLSGSGNVSYTNSTGQNVRLVINYLRNITEDGTMSFQGVTVTLPKNTTYGKTLAYQSQESGTVSSNQSMSEEGTAGSTEGSGVVHYVPLEIAIANGETFSINNASSSSYIEGYNIIIIPEAG